MQDLTPRRYNTRLRWSGSTGQGWDGYDRAHTAAAPPADQEIRLTTGEAHGDPAILNPEQLLVMAASSCQMLWFLHLAAKARIDVVDYADEAGGIMHDDDPGAGVSEITLRPQITVAGDASEERVLRLVHTAHKHCNIANSLKSDVRIDAHVRRAPLSP